MEENSNSWNNDLNIEVQIDLSVVTLDPSNSHRDQTESVSRHEEVVASSKPNRRRNPWGEESYAELIARAIMSSPCQKLTLQEIYGWLIENIPFFAARFNEGKSKSWKNSIRHNLSLHSRFQRIGNPGHNKGSFWVINTDPKSDDKRKLPKEPNIKCQDDELLGKKKRGRPISGSFICGNHAQSNISEPTMEQIMNPCLQSLPQLSLGSTQEFQSTELGYSVGNDGTITTGHGNLLSLHGEIICNDDDICEMEDGSFWQLVSYTSTNPSFEQLPSNPEQDFEKLDKKERFRKH